MAWPDPADWTVLTCGAGTLLLRTLPFIIRPRPAARQAGRLARWWAAFTTAIGPAALGTLLTVSVLPLIQGGAQPQPRAAAVVAGLLAVVVARLRLGGVVWAMLAGALVYTLFDAWLTTS